MREQLEIVDERTARFSAALDANAEHRAGAVREILLSARIAFMIGQARIIHPAYRVVLLEVFGHGLRILDMPLHPQGQRFQPDDVQEAVEGRLAPAEVAQAHHPRAANERRRAERIGQDDIVIGRLGLDDAGVAPAGLPVEVAAVDDRAANAQPVATDPLGGGVNDDVYTVLERAAEVGRCERVSTTTGMPCA